MSVMGYFRQICAIPHGSFHTEQISSFLEQFAQDEKLRYVRDEAGNVIIFKPASPGYEDHEPLILQGHVDMVLEKTADCTKDLEKEAITLIEDGEWLKADRTTLGADDGTAVAMMMEALSDNSLAHPPLECVFTVNEEVGMLGAEALDTSVLSGTRLLNLDSEEEGVLTAGCAGGAEETFRVPFKTETEDGILVEILVDGLLGGHSGDAINRGRANADFIMARLLYRLMKKYEFNLVSIEGGNKDNAIPRECRASILFPNGAEQSTIEKTVQKIDDQIVAEYSRTDPELSVTWNWKGDENLRRDVLCMTEKATRKALRLLMALPNGVIEYSPDFPGLPQTSLSMGILKTEMPEDEDGEIVLTGTFLVRSSINSQKGYVINRLEAIVKEFDGELTECGVYPAWEYRPDSSFRNMIVSVFEAKFGRKPEVVMIHGGLECGLLSGKIAGLDCVSIGPDTEDIHTPAERLNIPSFERTWELVKGIMEQA